MLLRLVLFSFFFWFNLNTNSLNASELPKIPITSEQDANLKLLSKRINTPYTEYDPFITPDEQWLYFQSDAPNDVGKTGSFDIWVAKNIHFGTGLDIRAEFSLPTNLGKPVNTIEWEGQPSLRMLANGDYEMYFASKASKVRNGPLETNIYYTKQVQGKWLTPTSVIELNTDFHDRMPSISSDGSTLYFSSDRPGGQGNDDIWIAKFNFQKKQWDKPVNAGNKINSAYSEFSPSIHNDGITLYFSSNRKGGVGGHDIYFTQKNQLQLWNHPQNLGRPYNSEFDEERPTLPRHGKVMYFTSNRDVVKTEDHSNHSSEGDYDIYQANVPYFAKPEVIVTLRGIVHEENTRKGLDATMRIEGPMGVRYISTSIPDGKYQLDFRNHQLYDILVVAPGFEPYRFKLDLRDIHKATTLTRQIPMRRGFKIPKQLLLKVIFRNPSGDILKPRVTFDLLKDKLPQRVAISGKKDGAYRLYIPLNQKWSENKLADYLDKEKITLSARISGYQNFDKTLALKSYFNTTKVWSKSFSREKTIEVILNVLPKLKTTKKKKSTTLIDLGKAKEIKPDITAKDKDKIELKKDFDKTNFKKITKKELVATMYFATANYNQLSPEDSDKLEKIVNIWLKNKNLFILVEGHTDTDGSFKYNAQLSRNRAFHVKKLLVNKGIDRRKIRPNWFGYRFPFMKGLSETAKAKNRRVEIFFSKD